MVNWIGDLGFGGQRPTNDVHGDLNAFNRDYRTGNIAPNIRAVQSRTVEDAIRSI